MNQRKLRLFSIVYLVITQWAGCSSGVLKVQSFPEDSEVWLVTSDGKETKLGKTPIQIDPHYITETKMDFARIKIFKEGYYPESVVVPKTLIATDTSIFASLRETDLVATSTQVLNKVTERVSRILSLIQQKKLIEAKELALLTTTQYPNISVGFDLLGNIYYLLHDVPNAINAYRKSNLISPGNLATEHMLQKLSQFYNKAQGGQ